MKQLQQSGQGDPELDPYRPLQLILTSTLPGLISGGQAMRLLMLVWGWEQDFELASLSAGVCFHDRWWMVT